jgi:hypothetical protein
MERYQVTDGEGFRLADHDPGATSGVDSKTKGRAEVAGLTTRMEDLQRKLYADGRHKLLVVLQGMDTSGKGGAIRKAFEALNPTGVHVASFKAPTEPELAHDYLWRVHPHVPGDGMISIFDRSHYEDVLIVRVRGLVPKKRWKARYGHIRDFEQMLVDEGTTIRSTSCTSRGRSRPSACRPASTTPPSGGSSAWPTWPSASCGTTTSTPTRTRSARPPLRTPPGSWCPPIASGTATW